MRAALTYSLPLWFVLTLSCSVRYSFTGGQFGQAKTFTVAYFNPQTALATQVYAQRLTEKMRDLLLAQSPLQMVGTGGDLQFEGSVTEYRVQTATATAAETAGRNRLTIGIKVKYTNLLEPELSFERSFTRFADFDGNADLFSVEEQLWETINDQLTQDMYNASVGNW
ncbi:MAG TPA: hypothetical protein DCF33_02675 [Saprospirales bacterium]|nr:hypothetical protein [Saprospirales bacterium]